MTSARWGEFVEEDPQSSESITTAELVKMFIMRAMRTEQLWCPGPQPSSNPQNASTTNVNVDSKPEIDLLNQQSTLNLEIDHRVIHTIKLLKHGKEMRQMIEAAREHKDLMADSLSFPPALDIPVHPVAKCKHELGAPIPYMDKEFTDFTLGKGTPTVEISEATAKMMLKKSVAAVLAHSGFDDTSESVLCTAAGATENFIRKFVSMLRVAVDRGGNLEATGFPDAVERTFHEIGLGSVRVLHDFYQDRIIKYHYQTLQNSRALNEEYNHLAFPVPGDSDLKKTLNESDDVPEIHFFGLGEDAVDELQSSLEPGFQMLSNLEQAGAHSLESQDENLSANACTGSPAIDASSSDLHSSKKRRRN